MCDYSQVIYHQCGHIRYLVLAWCHRYQRTHERCPPNIIDIDNKFHEKCGRNCPPVRPPLSGAHPQSRLTDVGGRDVPESFVSGHDDGPICPAAASESRTSSVTSSFSL